MLLEFTIVFQWMTFRAFATSPFQDNVCSQCNLWCPTNSNVQGQSRRGESAVRGSVGPPGRKGDSGLPGLNGARGEKGQKGNIGHPANIGAIEELVQRKVREAISGEPYADPETPFESCSDVRRHWLAGQGSPGIAANITIPGIGELEVYCDFTTDGGDWLVFQRRFDGSVDFYRGWDDYVRGFGDKDGEFWLGLGALYQITSSGKWEMRIDMITTKDEKYYAKYSWFRINPAWDNYRLRTLNGYSGNASTSLRIGHRGRQFTTYDVDNDATDSENCAEKWHGAWWYKTCADLHSNLNGKFNVDHYDGMSWYKPLWGWLFMKSTEMKIRRRKS